MKRWHTGWIAGLAMALVGSVSAAHADKVNAVAAVNGWYASLLPGQDADAMAARAGALLAEDAVIDLRDLGITQTRDEYLESLDVWADAVAGGTVAHRIEPGYDATSVAATVCFRFADNEVLNRETFTLSDGLIVNAVFVQLGDDCTDF
ncbi:MAG: nuclear transport factor 2 family protein [Phyllobacteriaceae bacterium]|nr:nuclear transport factor 2 family protein [Phyllobacteriaceae bacterium]